MTVSRKWSLLAGLLVIVVFAAGWFLLIAPKRTEAAELQAKRLKTASDNEQLVQNLEQLKQQSQDLPALKAELATMRKQIPDNPALPTLIRDLTAAGRKAGVEIVTLAPSTPALVAADVAVPVASTTTGTATDTTTDSTTAAAGAVPAPAPAAAAAPALYEIPLTVNVTGNYFALEQFVAKLEKLRRSFQVTGFSLTPATTANASSDSAGKPLSLGLTGRVFLSPKVAPAVAAAPTAAATPATAASPAATPAAGTTTP